MGVWYCTREDVKLALDFAETARADTRIDRAIEAASRGAEQFLHRRFYPWTGTRYFSWPDPAYRTAWRLWLDADELISVTTLSAAGIAVGVSGYYLEPVNTGPPYNRVEINLASQSAFGTGSTHQRDIAIVGVWCGCSADEAPAGALAEALDASETGVDVTDSASIGVGSIIRVDNERMIVTGKSVLDTGQNLASPLTANTADTTVAVATGSAYTVGETLLLDAERMLVVDIAGNNLTVKRAYDGSVLAAHTGSDIYAPRTLMVERGALGTTAATHLTAAAANRHVVPGPVRALVLAEAVNQVLQESGGYARTVGTGSAAQTSQGTARAAGGAGLPDIREQAYTACARKARTRAV